MNESRSLNVNKLNGIQSLRAIAALLILWHHAKIAVHSVNPSFLLPPWLDTSIGAIGVDLFFCISGYVICLSISRKSIGSMEFILARIARIVPIYFVLNFVILAMRYVHPGSIIALSNLWNSFLFIPIWDVRSFSDPLHYYGWTLCFEMWFYTGLALTMRHSTTERATNVFPLVLVASAAVAGVYKLDWYLPKFLFNPMGVEFALGCFIFKIRKYLTPSISSLLLLAALSVFLFISPGFQKLGSHGWAVDNVAVSWLRVFKWGIPSAFLLAAVVFFEQNHGKLWPKALVQMGNISYSFYLAQPFAVSVGKQICLHLHLSSLGAMLGWYVGCAFFFGWLLNVLLEKPLTAMCQRWFASFRREQISRRKTAILQGDC